MVLEKKQTLILNPNNQIVHGLWIGGALSPLEVLCIESFLQNGHQFYLWTYETVLNVPKSAQLKDANFIIPEISVFKYQNKNKYGHGKDSYAGFSDVFRYKLLYDFGGWWTDMDITLLKSLDFEDEYVFRHHHKAGAVGNLMKTPQLAPIMKHCYEKAIIEVRQENQNWMLPIEILNEGITIFKLKNYIKEFSNIDSFPMVATLLLKPKKINENWFAIHWMNEEFRRLNLSKNCFEPKATIGYLLKKHGIEFEKYIEKKRILNFIKLNRFYYLYVNLVARITWFFNNLRNSK